MSSYTGWKKIDKVYIVYSETSTEEYDGKVYRRAEICEAKKTKACEKILETCKRKICKPRIVEADNKDFTFRFINSLGSSFYGKLSYWKCLVEKDGFDPFLVYIDANFIANLIMESNISNGLVKEKLFFARKDGLVGILHDGMTAYKDLINDAEIKKDIVRDKTTKWRIGYKYNTLTKSDTFFGYFSPICTSLQNHAYRGVELDFVTPDKPYFRDSDTIEKGAECFVSFESNGPAKCPSRQEGDKVFDVPANYYQEFADNVAKYIVHKNISRNSNFNMYYWHWSTIEPIFNIFRQAPDTSIQLMTDLRNHFATHLDNISKGIRNKDEMFYEDKYFTVEHVAYHDADDRNLKVIYAGETKTFSSDYVGYFDYLIEILKKEKAKL